MASPLEVIVQGRRFGRSQIMPPAGDLSPALLTETLRLGYSLTPILGSGLSGTFSHGNSMTLVGSGFGSKSPAAPDAYDDFQSVTLAANITTSTGASWTQSPSNTYHPIASANRLRSGTPFDRNMLCRWDGSQENATSSVCLLSRAYTSFLIDAYLYLDISALTSWWQNLKPFRLHQTSADPDGSFNMAFTEQVNNYPVSSGNAYPSQMDGVTGNCLGGSNFSATPFWDPAGWYGKWVHITAMVKVGTGNHNSDGSIRFHVSDGTTFYVDSASGCPTTEAGQDDWNEIYVGNYVRGDAFTGQGRKYWECLYIDNTWKRVEIGNHATRTSASHREIQKPTAWSDSSISFTVNRGEFGASDNVWIYVIDENDSLVSTTAATLGTTY